MAEDNLTVIPKENQVAIGTTPADILHLAVSQGADIDKLEKLMALQERWEANEAKKAYVAAMAAFKKNPPKINKDKNVSYTGTSYNHASLANVTEKINSALSAHGLSAGWNTEQTGDNIKVTCTITHEAGHSESTSLSAGPDDSGKKNKIQQIGSTISYLERYTILALAGLATHDMDNDGGGSGPGLITESQANTIDSMIKENGLDSNPKYRQNFLKWMKADSIESIKKQDYSTAISGIKTAIKKNKPQDDGGVKF